MSAAAPTASPRTIREPATERAGAGGGNDDARALRGTVFTVGVGGGGVPRSIFTEPDTGSARWGPAGGAPVPAIDPPSPCAVSGSIGVGSGGGTERTRGSAAGTTSIPPLDL